MNMNKREKKELAYSKILLVVLAVIGLALVVWFAWVRPSRQVVGIDSFAECGAAGYPIQESFPEVCVTPSGERFVNPDQQAQAPASDDGTGEGTPPLVITEWGVQVPVTPATDDLTYRYVKNDTYEAVFFTYRRLQDAGICKEDAGVAIARKKTDNQPPYDIDNQQSFKKLGDYYYYASYGGAPCYDPDNSSQAAVVEKVNGGDLKGGITKALGQLELAD